MNIQANLFEMAFGIKEPLYIKRATSHFKNAEISFDKFHVIKRLNEAIDKIRRTETAVKPCLKGSGYIRLKNPEHLTTHQRKNLKTLSKKQETGESISDEVDAPRRLSDCVGSPRR